MQANQGSKKSKEDQTRERNKAAVERDMGHRGRGPGSAVKPQGSKNRGNVTVLGGFKGLWGREDWK